MMPILFASLFVREMERHGNLLDAIPPRSVWFCGFVSEAKQRRWQGKTRRGKNRTRAHGYRTKLSSETVARYHRVAAVTKAAGWLLPSGQRSKSLAVVQRRLIRTQNRVSPPCCQASLTRRICLP